VKNQPVINAVAVTILIVASMLVFRWHQPRPPGIDPRPHEGLGEALATEAVRLLQPGARLIVIARDTARSPMPAADAQLKGLLRGVRQAGQAVAELRRIQLDPLRPTAVPRGDFYDLLRLGRESDVIVSLLGPPLLDPGQKARLDERPRRILAACTSATPTPTELRQLAAEGLLTVAVVRRPDAPAHAGAGSRQKAFGQLFEVRTAAQWLANPLPGSAAD
jgi:hypothetical protein